jgi:hypothetical protein
LLRAAESEIFLNLGCLLGGELRAIASALPGTIAHVVSIGAKKPMTRPHAQSVIASMTDVHGVRVSAILNEVTNASRSANDVIDADLWMGPFLVTTTARGCPRPTSVWTRGFINLSCEVFKLKFCEAGEWQRFCMDHA